MIGAMLLISSETIRSNPALNDVVREMSFTLSYFAKSSTFSDLMAGQSRRIIILAEADLTRETLSSLKGREGPDVVWRHCGRRPSRP